MLKGVAAREGKVGEGRELGPRLQYGLVERVGRDMRCASECCRDLLFTIGRNVARCKKLMRGFGGTDNAERSHARKLLGCCQ